MSSIQIILKVVWYVKEKETDMKIGIYSICRLIEWDWILVDLCSKGYINQIKQSIKKNVFLHEVVYEEDVIRNCLTMNELDGGR